MFALHRAHVERIPYEAWDIPLRGPIEMDPLESVAKIFRGRGGYCFQLNNAFAELLAALGYDVTRHRSGVQVRPEDEPPGRNGNHMALTVRCEGRAWFVDVGLGDALHEPLPLRPGTYRQGPMTFVLEHSELIPGGWRMTHDPKGSFVLVDIATEPATVEEFTEAYLEKLDFIREQVREYGFVRSPAVYLRDAYGVDALSYCVLRRVEDDVREKEVATPDEWFGALSEVFGLTADAMDARERTELWDRIHPAHLRWRDRDRRRAKDRIA
ncbi:hypothetical protein ACZ90_58515 [Streptomyces albus subsp. albus]|nr:hypothetical protein ACZ90_58515 [Streptomyces albus subsp. albus]